MNLPYRLILGSKSPRRKELLKGLGFDFKVEVKPVDERFPQDYPVAGLAEYIANIKADAFKELALDELVITSDTVVLCNEKALAKPSNSSEAKIMLNLLSGKTHSVITGVCLKTAADRISFSETTLVKFDQLSASQIDFYINNYKPFDKAGAYGIQEWIGMVGIKGIEGDYYNVMGLPLHRLYKALNHFKA